MCSDGRPDVTVSEADMRLIAAAPELLAVCQDTLVKLEHLHSEGVVQMPRTIEALRRAIAKADIGL